ncbi:glycine cleavage system protein R [Psychrosphaera ytuae]|uniref:Glycine cleavage system transcriptional repressor n=1 Tax=Psychrosphaera ytuae TaxID=2820710 RepID=A0A975DDV0_9GAMM|nr:ACT domain-containing protein [Psychrosphaera ytuae]QTH65149.1 glycine cleavage system protein R [Psychrosphaera ytuae]
MKHLVLTVIAEDKTGLVEKISNVVFAHEANWLASNLSILSGYFAGVIEVMVPETQLAELQKELSDLPGMQITTHLCEALETKPAQDLELVITGNDRKGIVQELSTVINHKGANIVSFVSSHQSAPNWGGELFHAVAKVTLPEGMDPDVIVNALEQIASDIIVDIELEEAV